MPVDKIMAVIQRDIIKTEMEITIGIATKTENLILLATTVEGGSMTGKENRFIHQADSVSKEVVRAARAVMVGFTSLGLRSS